MSRRTLESLVALCVIAVLFYFLMVKVILVTEPPRPAPERHLEAPRVASRTLEAGFVKPPVVLTGSLAPAARVTLSVETGGRVVEVLEDWRAGREVAAGELLLGIDARPLELALATAEARETEARAALGAATIEVQSARGLLPILAEAVAVARRERARLEGLRETGEASPSMIDAALAAEVQARLAEENGKAQERRALATEAQLKAAAKSALAAVDQAREALRHVKLRAPFAGVLTADGPELGALVMPGSALVPGTGLGELVDLDSLRLVAQAHESLLGRLKLGSEAHLSLPSQPGTDLIAQHVRIAPLADPLTRSLAIEFEVAQPKERRLPAGLFAEVSLPAEAGPGGRVRIERGEFLWSRGGDAVAFVAADSADQVVAEPRALQLGSEVGEGFEVLSGLSAGEELITGPLDRLDPELATPITLIQP